MSSSFGRETETDTRWARRRSFSLREQSLHEKDTPRKKGVIRLERSDSQKNHQQHSRDQNGIHHGQPLPEHVHENGHDQPRLQQHEHDDQEPPEVTLKVEVVDKIRRRAENEQQSPDLEIDADRMLLPLYVCGHVPSPQIENCKDEYPYQIDEVPVQAHDFDDLVFTLPPGHEARPLVIQISPNDLRRHDQKKNHADRHVRTVEARDHEKSRAELGRTQGVAPGTYSLMDDQLGPLEGLHPDERGAQCRGAQEQEESHLPVFFIAELDRHGHGPAAADQDEGHYGDQKQGDALAEQLQAEDLARVGPGVRGG